MKCFYEWDAEMGDISQELQGLYLRCDTSVAGKSNGKEKGNCFPGNCRQRRNEVKICMMH